MYIGRPSLISSGKLLHIVAV